MESGYLLARVSVGPAVGSHGPRESPTPAVSGGRQALSRALGAAGIDLDLLHSPWASDPAGTRRCSCRPRTTERARSGPVSPGIGRVGVPPEIGQSIEATLRRSAPTTRSPSGETRVSAGHESRSLPERCAGAVAAPHRRTKMPDFPALLLAPDENPPAIRKPARPTDGLEEPLAHGLRALRRKSAAPRACPAGSRGPTLRRRERPCATPLPNCTGGDPSVSRDPHTRDTSEALPRRAEKRSVVAKGPTSPKVGPAHQARLVASGPPSGRRSIRVGPRIVTSALPSAATSSRSTVNRPRSRMRWRPERSIAHDGRLAFSVGRGIPGNQISLSVRRPGGRSTSRRGSWPSTDLRSFGSRTVSENPLNGSPS